MLARVIEGVVAEYRDLDIADVPEHKRGLWLPVVHEGEGDNVSIAVEPDKVVITHTMSAPSASIISDRQFFHQLAAIGVITKEEALAAVGPGVIPAALQAIVDTMPEDQRFAAMMLLTGATQFERQHPLVATFAAFQGWPDQQLDEFWLQASTL